MTAKLRENAPAEIARRKVTAIRDYKSGEITNVLTGEKSATGLPSSDILYYVCDGCITVVRPSGTEPKLKIYFMANADSKDDAEAIIAESLADMKAKLSIQ